MWERQLESKEPQVCHCSGVASHLTVSSLHRRVLRVPIFQGCYKDYLGFSDPPTQIGHLTIQCYSHTNYPEGVRGHRQKGSVPQDCPHPGATMSTTSLGYPCNQVPRQFSESVFSLSSYLFPLFPHFLLSSLVMQLQPFTSSSPDTPYSKFI